MPRASVLTEKKGDFSIGIMSQSTTHDFYGENGDLRHQYTPARLA